MDTQVINTIKRFFLLVIIQVLVLKHINIGWSDFNFIHFFIYPLFILLLPLKTQRSLMLILAFVFGLIIDMFYDSPGLHAGSLVFLAYSGFPTNPEMVNTSVSSSTGTNFSLVLFPNIFTTRCL